MRLGEVPERATRRRLRREDKNTCSVVDPFETNRVRVEMSGVCEKVLSREVRYRGAMKEYCIVP